MSNLHEHCTHKKSSDLSYECPHDQYARIEKQQWTCLFGSDIEMTAQRKYLSFEDDSNSVCVCEGGGGGGDCVSWTLMHQRFNDLVKLYLL